jgi:hypothetical protein
LRQFQLWTELLSKFELQEKLSNLIILDPQLDLNTPCTSKSMYGQWTLNIYIQISSKIRLKLWWFSPFSEISDLKLIQ